MANNHVKRWDPECGKEYKNKREEDLINSTLGGAKEDEKLVENKKNAKYKWEDYFDVYKVEYTNCRNHQ